MSRAGAESRADPSGACVRAVVACVSVCARVRPSPAAASSRAEPTAAFVPMIHRGWRTCEAPNTKPDTACAHHPAAAHQHRQQR